MGDLNGPFRELFELSPDPILVFVQGVITQANPAAVLLLRAKTAADLIGLASRSLIAPEFLPMVARHADALMNGSAASTRGEERYIRLDGSVVDVEATAARAPFLDGKAFMVILRDITDRKELEARQRSERESEQKAQAAEERERWLRELIDHLPMLVFAMDERGAFILVNDRCSELFDRPAADLLGKTLDRIGASRSACTLFGGNDEILLTGKPEPLLETSVRDAQGRLRVFEGVKVLLRRGEQRPAVLGALTELTERRELQDKLLRAQKMEAIGRLAGGVAHDFNNLLSVILESTEHLSSRALDPDGDLDRIRDAADLGASLTRQLLTFARHGPLEPRLTSMDALVSRMTTLLTRVLGENVTVVKALRAPDAHVEVDAGQLEVVLMNVAANARDAMPAGGTLEISTRTCTERVGAQAASVPCVELEIRDTGIGMDEATRKRAFDPFFTTKKVGVGTGLGLSTSYGIVERLGGRIEVDSEPNQGTRVRVILPVCAALPPVKVVVSETSWRPAGGHGPPARRRARRASCSVTNAAVPRIHGDRRRAPERGFGSRSRL